MGFITVISICTGLSTCHGEFSAGGEVIVSGQNGGGQQHLMETSREHKIKGKWQIFRKHLLLDH